MQVQLHDLAMKRVRKSRGMSISELARRSGLTPATVSWSETGRFIPYDSQLERIAGALGVENPEELLEIEEG